MTKIAIIVGSTRPGRKAEEVARWVHDLAITRDDATFEIVDLADYPLPHLDEPAGAGTGPQHYSHPHTREWAAKIAAFDGYVFVTPEYNHSTSGVLKNAIDFLYAEWGNKAAGFVSYGGTGGTRAVEHLRLIMGELRVADVRHQVALSLFTDFDADGTLVPGAHQEPTLTAMLDEVIAWADALATLRGPIDGHGELTDNRETATEAPVVTTEGRRPSLGSNGHAAEASDAVAGFVAELQAGLDSADADVYDRHFATDLLWGSPYGQTLAGFAHLNAAHRSQMASATAPPSRYEVVQVLAPTPGVALAHVRRQALPAEDPDGFSEMALYALVQRDGQWWLAAGQNTPVTDKPS